MLRLAPDRQSEAAARDLYLELLFQASALYCHYNCSDLVKRAMEAAGVPSPKGTFAKAYKSFAEMCLDARARA